MYIVAIIVVAIIAFQIFFFYKNLKQMNIFANIFAAKWSWEISYDKQTNFVCGITGGGNEVFKSIEGSINEYLSNNKGSVIDFQLLKDAVDRHCDAVENDVNTLTPIPLYCGLAGTMIGVIIGLSSLINTGSIESLLTSGAADFGSAASGVNDLLTGVAWAMGASICGILFTTIGSLIFKNKKIKGEKGKDSFLAWLQAKLLPELPSDTSDALNRLVKNLNRFNSTFADNTTHLRSALREVNDSYRVQGDIIKAVHDMDVMKMSKANINVLKELKECTDKLEQFNQYLNDIHGYTDAIHTFTSQFEHEAGRLQVLEDIKRFFEKHKGIMAKDVADSDAALREALKTVKESANTNSVELNKTLTEQAEAFKQIIKDERESFEKLSKEIAANFQVELEQIPMLQQRFAEISAIPMRLDNLISKIEASNSKLASIVADTMDKAAQKLVSSANDLKKSASCNSSNQGFADVNGGFPKWMRWTIVISAIVVAIACLANTVNNIWFHENPSVVVSDSTKQENWFDTVSNVLPDTTSAVRMNYGDAKPISVNVAGEDTREINNKDLKTKSKQVAKNNSIKN